MNNKNKRFRQALLTFAAVALIAAGCSNAAGTDNTPGTTPNNTNKPAETNGNTEPVAEDVTIKISNWPKPNDEANLLIYKQYLEAMNAQYPNVKVETDEWGYDVNSFLPKAASGQLPTLYETYFTETDKIINARYAADITKVMKEKGYADAINPELLELVEKDGSYYGIPKDAYVVGMIYNVDLFKQAGLVDDKGVPQFPKTYEELALTAQQIKEKTGKTGFFLPTKNNQGGWMFMNIAWAFGAEFETQVDGKWQAAFDSPEAAAALQYVKDLKWKYDVLPANNLVDVNTDLLQQFGTGQVAMAFGMPDYGNAMIQYLQMPRENFAMSALPEGPAGPASLLGGGLYMFSPSAKEAELSAAIDWLGVKGFTPQASEEALQGLENSMKVNNEQNLIVGPTGIKVWVNEDRLAAEQAIIDKYTNVDMALYQDYMDNASRGMRAEVPINAQELYKMLDFAIQEVLTNKDADPAALLARVATEFQKDYLDKVQ